MMNTKEYRGKSLVELKAALQGQLEEQFKLRMQHSIGQLSQTHLLKDNRRNIARMKTLIKESVGV